MQFLAGAAVFAAGVVVGGALVLAASKTSGKVPLADIVTKK
jgi:hypothetical protein